MLAMAHTTSKNPHKLLTTAKFKSVKNSQVGIKNSHKLLTTAKFKSIKKLSRHTKHKIKGTTCLDLP